MKRIILFALTFSLLLVQNMKASHIADGDLSYTCLGNNQYQINLNLFVDCLSFDPGAQQTIDFTSTCGGTATMLVDVTDPGGTEISQLCPSQINNSTCNGGNLPDMWVFHFTGIFTLAPQCDTWTMSWITCCRNAAILNITSADLFGSYIQATVVSVTSQCNKSPKFFSVNQERLKIIKTTFPFFAVLAKFVYLKKNLNEKDNFYCTNFYFIAGSKCESVSYCRW